MKIHNDLNCKTCNTLFKARRIDAKYCSAKCKYKDWVKNNPEKAYATQKKFRDTHKEYTIGRQRKYHLKKNYDLTEEQYKFLLEKQNGCCAICGTNKPTGKWKVFAVDHCHITNTIRGILCNECNRGIGLLKDNAVLLMKAATYIHKHTEITNKEREKNE